jgi:hypothetical protein
VLLGEGGSILLPSLGAGYPIGTDGLVL